MAYRDKIFKEDGVWWASWLSPIGWQSISCPSWFEACKVVAHLNRFTSGNG